MEWYKSLALFACPADPERVSEESVAADQDRRLLSLLVEKVVLPKMTQVVKAAYDPLSATQTQRCVALLARMFEDYPTLTGESKQVRELLKEVRDKVKTSVETDPYIPIGYSKQ